MNESRRSPWLIALGVGCVVVLCCVVLVAAGAAAFFIVQAPVAVSTYEEITAITVEVAPFTITPVATDAPTAIPPTDLPTATQESAQPEPTAAPTQLPPTASGPALTGNQRITENSIFDDFSSQALNWPTFDDGATIIRYDDDGYRFKISEANYYDWAYFPVGFIPYEISFDVQGLPGSQDGTFGVFCQYQDEDNYYYLEFDLEDNFYIISQAINGEYISLTESDTSDDDWLYAPELNAPASEVNHIGISCYLESITLYINDEFVNEVSVDQPFDRPGRAAFFVYAYEFVDDNGYEVIFDNVEAYEPVQ